MSFGIGNMGLLPMKGTVEYTKMRRSGLSKEEILRREKEQQQCVIEQDIFEKTMALMHMKEGAEMQLLNVMHKIETIDFLRPEEVQLARLSHRVKEIENSILNLRRELKASKIELDEKRKLKAELEMALKALSSKLNSSRGANYPFQEPLLKIAEALSIKISKS